MHHLLLFIAVLALASIGHAAFWVPWINISHGTRQHLGWRLLRRVVYLILLAGPLAMLVAGWSPLGLRGDWHALAHLSPFLLGYGAACVAIGGLWVPWLTWRRSRRLPPPHAGAVARVVLDVADELGVRPVGRGRRGWQACLPGNQAYSAELVERTLWLPQLPPAWDGLRLLHLTDLHLWGRPDRSYFERVLAYCAQRSADLLCITGDIVDSLEHAAWIQPLLGQLHWNFAAFAVLGNHDALYDPALVRTELSRLGIEPLGGRAIVRSIRGAPLIVLGNERPWLGGLPKLDHLPAGGFRLGLSHSPDQMPWARAANVDLLLAGHVHGGQIRLPVVGSVLCPSWYGRYYDCGLFFETPTLLHVSRGLSGTYPVRYGCRPEVVWLTLRAGSRPA